LLASWLRGSPQGRVVGKIAISAPSVKAFIFGSELVTNCGDFYVYKYPEGAPPTKTYAQMAAIAPVGFVITN
jgi:hypothetical protein